LLLRGDNSSISREVVQEAIPTYHHSIRSLFSITHTTHAHTRPIRPFSCEQRKCGGYVNKQNREKEREERREEKGERREERGDIHGRLATAHPILNEATQQRDRSKSHSHSLIRPISLNHIETTRTKRCQMANSTYCSRNQILSSDICDLTTQLFGPFQHELRKR
jgi:hypothetical protein